jgi:hypothetical protein
MPAGKTLIVTGNFNQMETLTVANGGTLEVVPGAAVEVASGGKLDLSALTAADAVTLEGPIEVSTGGTLIAPTPDVDEKSPAHGQTPQVKYDGGRIKLNGGAKAYFATQYYICPAPAEGAGDTDKPVYAWGTGSVELKGTELVLNGNLSLIKDEYLLHTATVASGELTIADTKKLTVLGPPPRQQRHIRGFQHDHPELRG